MNKGIKTSLLAMITVLLMALLMPAAMAYDHDQTYDANATYFVVEDVRTPDNVTDRTVEVWINTSVGVTNGLVKFCYDSDCANVTSAAINTSNWDSTVSTTLLTGETWLAFSESSGSGNSDRTQIGELTIQCNASSCCGTVLGWMAGGSALNYVDGAGIPKGPIPGVNWANGTFLCGDGIDVEKTVWDESTSSWVDPLTLDSSWMGKDVRFNITVTAGCLDLSNVVVSDTMDPGLLFNDTPSPPWTVGALAADASTSIYFNATIDGYGPQVNTATATATVDDLAGLGVQADDTATVDTCPPAGFDVNKTVWDGSAWVELVSGAEIGNTYRFRVEVENTGSPTMDICTMTVTDVLPGNLAYADSAKLQDHHGVWWDLPDPPGINDLTNNTYGWIIDNTVPGECLQPGQKIVIEYNATVTDYGPGTNNVTAKGHCAVAGQWVQESDNASVDVPMPDLNVSKITLNPTLPRLCDMAFGPTNHTGARTQCNSISADIVEGENVNVVFPFDVVFTVTHVPTGNVVTTCVETRPGMAAGATETVFCNCSFYPFALEDYTISVTVDPANDVPEEDEGNNTLLRDITAYIHGLKGDSWQAEDMNISTAQCHEKGNINLVYSVGDSWKMQAIDVFNAGGVCMANWTVGAAGDLDVPSDGTTIKKARLYVYYNYDKTPDWNVTNYFTLKFNGYTLPPDAIYSDTKSPSRLLPSFGGYCSGETYNMCGGSPYGMVAYNVTHKFNVMPGDNTAELTLDPYAWQNNYTGITGMLLTVVYEHSDEPERIIWINEGFDMLQAHKKYGTTSEEATTYAPFAVCGTPIPANMQKATIVTVTNHAKDTPASDKNRLYFNGDLLGSGVWSYVGATQIGYDVTDIPVGLLNPTDNTAAFQSHIPAGGSSGDYMEATNAFLIVEEQNPVMSAEPDSDECYAVGEQFDVLVNITPLGVPLMGAQFDLYFNATALKAETVTYGDFLMGEGSVFVSHSDIDNANGVVSFAAARQGTSVGVTGPGTFAIVHFTAVTQGVASELNLTNALASDNSTPVNTYELVTANGTAEVCSNAPPVVVATSNFTYNNIAERGLSKAYFIGTGSYDPDEGTITLHEWGVDDGTNLVGEIAEHLFEVPMYWQGDQNGHYVNANVTLKVTDNGMPLMDNSTTMQVKVYIAGDATGDGRVNIADGVTFGMQFGESGINIGNPDKLCWEGVPEGDKADLNNDGRVNIGDAMLLGTAWGHTAW